jgi:hypothetical protein
VFKNFFSRLPAGLTDRPLVAGLNAGAPLFPPRCLQSRSIAVRIPLFQRLRLPARLPYNGPRDGIRADPNIQLLSARESGCFPSVFEDINVTKITVPLSGTGSGGRLPFHPFLIWGR